MYYCLRRDVTTNCSQAEIKLLLSLLLIHRYVVFLFHLLCLRRGGWLFTKLACHLPQDFCLTISSDNKLGIMINGQSEYHDVWPGEISIKLFIMCHIIRLVWYRISMYNYLIISLSNRTLGNWQAMSHSQITKWHIDNITDDPSSWDMLSLWWFLIRNIKICK